MERVLDEVRHRLQQPIRVGDGDGVGLGKHLELDPEGPRGGLVPLEGGKPNVFEVDRLGADGEGAPAEPGEVEEVADQPFEASRLPLDHDPRRRRLEHTVLESLRVPADRGQRRLQLVAHG